MALKPEKEVVNNELNFTDHGNLIPDELTMPNLPTGIHDFPTVASVGTKSIDGMAGSLDHFSGLYENSPPPAPRRLAAFLRKPEMIVRTMSLSLCASDEVSGTYSLVVDGTAADDVAVNVC